MCSVCPLRKGARTPKQTRLHQTVFNSDNSDVNVVDAAATSRRDVTPFVLFCPER